MTMTSEILTIIRKIFVVSDELTRMSLELKELTHTVNSHDVRLAVIENTLSMASRPGKLILPGN